MYTTEGWGIYDEHVVRCMVLVYVYAWCEYYWVYFFPRLHYIYRAYFWVDIKKLCQSDRVWIEFILPKWAGRSSQKNTQSGCWSTRGQTKSRTGQLADWVFRGLDNSWTMHRTTRGLVKVPIFLYSDSYTLTTQWPELALHCWQLRCIRLTYGTAHILFRI